MSTLRELYTELVDYLKDIMFQKGILERPSYMELSKKLDFTYNWIKDKKDTLKSHSPQKKTFNDLFNRLTEKYKDQLTNFRKTIEQKFQILYNAAFPHDSELPTSEFASNRSVKRRFFDDLKEIIRNYFSNIRIFDTDLSRILFNKARALKNSHFKEEQQDRRLDLSVLFTIIYRFRFITKEEFANKVRDIEGVDQESLWKISSDVENYIEKFVFSNPYKEKNYINDKYDIGTSYFKPEYDLTLKVWLILSKFTDRPILLKNIQRLLEYETFGRFTKGWEYSWDGLMNMLKKLNIILPKELYAKSLIHVKRYVEQRNLYQAEPRIYHPSWYTQNVIKFHIVILLIRDLGLDILNLELIKPEAFKKKDIMESHTYERHHIFINDKLSININRLILVMHKNHRALEGKTDLILGLIKSRIILSTDCPQYYKENIKNWKAKWQEYLERRKYLLEHGIAKFFKKYFEDNSGNNHLIERVFHDLSEYQIELEIKSMIQEWIQKGRPAPILNSQITARLSVDSKKQLFNEKLINNTMKFNS